MRAFIIYKKEIPENKPGIELNMNIKLNMKQCKSGIDLSRPDPYAP